MSHKWILVPALIFAGCNTPRSEPAAQLAALQNSANTQVVLAPAPELFAQTVLQKIYRLVIKVKNKDDEVIKDFVIPNYHGQLIWVSGQPLGEELRSQLSEKYAPFVKMQQKQVPPLDPIAEIVDDEPLSFQPGKALEVSLEIMKIGSTQWTPLGDRQTLLIKPMANPSDFQTMEIVKS